MYPSSIDVRQLRIAYTIVIASLSDIDDALVWLCLEILLKKTESIDPNNSNRGGIVITIFTKNLFEK